MKKCSKCLEVKPRSEFGRATGAKDGLFWSCNACRRAMRLLDRDNQRRRELLNRYGLTVAQFDRKLLKQGGRCAICGDLPAEGKSLVVDHDHSCCPGSRSCGNCVRDLLCHYCNSMLGYGFDNVDRLKSGSVYLDRWNSASVA